MKFAENLLGFLRMPQINPYLAVKIISLLIGITVIAFSLFTGWVFLRAKQSFDGFNMAEVIKYNPKLVFKRATFYKYVVVGTPDEASKYFKKLDLYHLKGSADFQFELSNLVIDETRTDYLTKTLYVTLRSEGELRLPLVIDVNILPEDIYPIPLEEAPEAVSRETAETIGKVAAVPASLLGSVIGGKAGGLAGGIIEPGIGQIVGGALGAMIGAGGGAYGTYVMTSNFFTGLQAKSFTLGEKDKIIEKSKPLIALELMGGSHLSSDSWVEDVKILYLEEFRKTLKLLFSSYGWKQVIIQGINIPEKQL